MCGLDRLLRRLISRSVAIVPWRLRSTVRTIPLISLLQRKLLSNTLYGKEFVHCIDAGPAKGLVCPITLPEDKGVWTGTYELEFVSAVAEAVKPGDVCCDIGAWHGYCGGVMACSGAKRVIFFEPLPDNCRRIERLVSLNPHLSVFELAACAVAESNGDAVFEIMCQSTMGRLDSGSCDGEAAGPDRIRVDVVSLDSFCAERGITHVDLVKIDIEGAELRALKGMVETISRCRPRLFIECHSAELTLQVEEFLTPLGYSVTVIGDHRKSGAHPPAISHLKAIAD